MAHIRKDSSKPTTTISWDEDLLSKVENYWHDQRKSNRSAGVNELVELGLRYVQLVEKKKAKKRLQQVPC
jgi:metal-responsive CopG/Arc/MetJ family transcriptional regulator